MISSILFDIVIRTIAAIAFLFILIVVFSSIYLCITAYKEGMYFRATMLTIVLLLLLLVIIGSVLKRFGL